MNRLPLVFLGVFFTLFFSWAGLIVGSNAQLGNLQPATPTLVNAEGTDVSLMAVQQAGRPGSKEQLLLKSGEDLYPRLPSGLGEQGKAVYIDLGCVYCHSQQVRREGFGKDFDRGWGARQTVARDYIRQSRVQLGTMRTGPDLTNIGLRQAGEAGAKWHYLHLYWPELTSPGSNMAPYPFLFEMRPVGDAGPSPDALQFPPVDKLPAGMPPELLPPPGYEVVPGRRARLLVAYLQSLNTDYDLPEAKRKE